MQSPSVAELAKCGISDMIYIVHCIAVFVLVVVSGATSAASTLDTPRREVILTVSGTMYITNFEGAALFDLEMLQNSVRISSRQPRYGRQVLRSLPGYDLLNSSAFWALRVEHSESRQ
jgi:hypothetical protein